MAYKRRSTERITEIDNFLSEHYEKNGPQYCADALNESKNYIFTRSYTLGIKYESCDKFNSKSKKVVRSSKSDRQQQRIDILMNINEKLRIENLKLVHDNMKFKRVTENE